MDKTLTQLTERMRDALGERVVSVLLYGSAASAGERGDAFSDLNVLCVLTVLTPRELADAEPVVRWWRDLGNPSPLLLTGEEVRTATDVFAIEFSDMVERRQVLWGTDVIAGLEIDRSFYRAQVEHDLRARQLRLRQKAAAVLTDREALLRLMLDSVSNFCVLARHAMLLGGIGVGTDKQDIVARLGEIGVQAEPFSTLLDVRARKRSPRDLDVPDLFGRYLSQTGRLVQYVDELEK